MSTGGRPGFCIGRMFHAGTICLVPVGLPARGKTFMSTKLSRYLRWLGVKTQVFNVGTYRRRMFGKSPDHKLFDPADADAMAKRNAAGDAAFDDMIKFFQSGGQVGIYDHTLTIMESKRKEIMDRLAPHKVHVVFLETICDNPKVIEANIREVKLNLPDYEGWMRTAVPVTDFLDRINHHVPYYQTLSDPSLTYIQVMNLGIDSNVGEHIVANNLKGYLQTRLAYYLLNIHITKRTVYLLRNAESVSDDTFKDDAPLSPVGIRHARQVHDFLVALRERTNEAGAPKYPKIFTSTRRRSHESAQFFPPELVTQKTSLVQLNPGAVEAMTDERIANEYPEEYARHQKDPFNHRYPRAESYHDLALRLEHVILELEGEKGDVLIIAHETVLRCLYAYLMDLEDKVCFCPFVI
ncbi:6-phosphofructo-2-kinase-domain-containing protein [Catenaria anguillulae PL171]|uniref:6-phosphofructo-2-kinase-domain-containing protein n=1 Tax=Catenaria anguillulae PL171 TaxID=765915 RepID=A0A1Y2HG30_9FUNG|nr:6-phosphofructo-2-kinase-domain-containing protein [Catenaria anguillulae PL171]